MTDSTSSTTADATSAATRFVITGFGPFGDVEENPTTVIVRRLDSYLRSSVSPSNISDGDGDIHGPNDGKDGCIVDNHHSSNFKIIHGSDIADLVKEYVILETSAQDVNETMDRIRKEHIEAATKKNVAATTSNQRIILFHLGVGRSQGFRLESCAYNEASFRIPDQKGYQPKEEPIVSDPCQKVGHCYETSIDLEILRHQLQRDFPTVKTVISTDPGRFVCNYVYCKSLEISQPHPTQKPPGASIDSEPTAATESFVADEENHCFIVDEENKSDDNHLLCESLFLHVPHFAIVNEEDQLAYVAGLLKNLIIQFS